jgi:hypothetical protein
VRRLLTVFREIAEQATRGPSTDADEIARRLTARYGGIVREELKNWMRAAEERVRYTDNSLEEQEKEIEDTVRDALLADGVQLPSWALNPDPRNRDKINEKHAVLLWLGFRDTKPLGLSGLWHLWEELAKVAVSASAPGTEEECQVCNPRLELPSTITKVFRPQGRGGEEQRYLDAVRIVLTAFMKAPKTKIHKPVSEAHRRLAKLLLDMEDDIEPPENLTNEDAALLRILAESLQVAFLATSADRETVKQLWRAVEIDEGEGGRVLSWVIRTCLNPVEAPGAVAAEMKKGVDLSVLRLQARNTLQDKVVSRIWSAL